ncbi:transglycosylase domain-containing protein, partial [Erysipelothrix rhusiopathiae]|nr:transglycosylase domain-containing protein [Erysipelothrix rhusiopathiae]
KKMIFELYINMINYGVPRTMGADASAQAYFGKRLSEINLTEAEKVKLEVAQKSIEGSSVVYEVKNWVKDEKATFEFEFHNASWT